jgi:hypothetical protein
MKTLVLAAGLALASLTAAQADGPVTGKDLYEGCIAPMPVQPPSIDKTKRMNAAQMTDAALDLAVYNKKVQPLIMCHNYILGVADGIGAFADLYGVKDCVPDGVEARDMKDVFINYYKAHPENRRLGAQQLVTAAFIDAWGCRFDSKKSDAGLGSKS